VVKVIKRIILIIILLLFVGGCSNKTAMTLFKMVGDKDAYVIEKQSMFESDKWDKMIIVFGFADDYSASKDIANYLMQDGGNYRVIPLKSL
jgi:hypothetical protein